MRVDVIGCCVLLASATGACANGGDPWSSPDTAAPVMNRSAPAPDGQLHVVFYPRIGSLADDTWGAVGPGVVLMNEGLAPTSAFSWMHDTVDRQRIAGDVVVLCTKGGDVYSSAIYAAAPFNSVQTVLVPPASPEGDVALVVDRLKTVEIVLLADGDASTYADWTGTPLGAAVREVYDRGGVVAGSGTGAAALGWAMLATHTDSATALADPYAPTITLVRGPFGLPLMAGTYVDLGLESSQRFGVLAAMTARAIADGLAETRPSAAMGVGLDRSAALAIDSWGSITLLAGDTAPGAAWIVHGGAVDQVAAGKALVWKAAQVTRFDAVGESFDVVSSCGTAFSYDVAIDGAAATPYTPADPYEAQGTATPCSL
jgi:cyanophycinase-like exopeptidase